MSVKATVAKATVKQSKGKRTNAKGVKDSHALIEIEKLLSRLKDLKSPKAKIRGMAFLGLPHPSEVEDMLVELMKAPLTRPQLQRKVDELIKLAIELVLNSRAGEEPATIIAIHIVKILKPVKTMLATGQK
jgi:hypothetical protein